MIYGIEDKTLTALGDVIREKTTVKYIGGGTDKFEAELFYNISIDTSAIEWKISGDNVYYAILLDLRTLLGDMYDITKNMYYNFEYESNMEEAFIIALSRDSGTNSISTYFLRESVKSEEGYVPVLSNSNSSYRLQLWIDKAKMDIAQLTFTLKLWACDENNNFIRLNKITPIEMIDILDEMDAIPPSAYEITGDCSYMFYQGVFDWYLKQCNDKITTRDIKNIDYMFLNSNIDTILFDLHIAIPYSYNSNMTLGRDCFTNSLVSDDTISLQRAPNIYLKRASNSSTPKTIIAGKSLLQELMRANPQEKKIFIEDDTLSFFPGANAFIRYDGVEEPHWLMDIIDFELMNTITGISENMCPTNLKYCDNLETIPSFPRFYNMNTNKYYNHWADMKFTNCYKLQSIVLPRPGPAELTSNVLDIFSGVPSMKSVKFDVQDNGSPYTAKWKSQSLSMVGVGYQSDTYHNTTFPYLDEQYRIRTADDYNRLKNHPKAWTSYIEYILYNHDKALETINTLPDTSAYGTNTIRFRGNAGSATDEGAINTLTPEEMAIATAKGWTIAFI